MTESSEQGGNKAGEKADGKKGGRCPVCGKPTEQRYRPFCSQRCHQIDLGRWLGETYRIAADQAPASPSSDPDED